MSVRITYLCEGSSDEGVARHIEQAAALCGVDATVSCPDLARLGDRVGRSTVDKLRAIRALGGSCDLAVVHRDADREGVAARRDEIAAAVEAVLPGVPHVCVVPVTMLEAWLLLDEATIRQVAENPRGRVRLDLPKPGNVERIADQGGVEARAGAGQRVGRASAGRVPEALPPAPGQAAGTAGPRGGGGAGVVLVRVPGRVGGGAARARLTPAVFTSRYPKAVQARYAAAAAADAARQPIR